MPNAKHLSREECDAMPAFVTYRLQHIFSFVEEKNLELIESKRHIIANISSFILVSFKHNQA